MALQSVGVGAVQNGFGVVPSVSDGAVSRDCGILQPFLFLSNGHYVRYSTSIDNTAAISRQITVLCFA